MAPRLLLLSLGVHISFDHVDLEFFILLAPGVLCSLCVQFLPPSLIQAFLNSGVRNLTGLTCLALRFPRALSFCVMSGFVFYIFSHLPHEDASVMMAE